MSLYVYHGTSSAFVKSILQRGFISASLDDQYYEVRRIMQKYVNPEILTDEFFKKHAHMMDGFSFSSNRVRTMQLAQMQAVGPFVAFANEMGDQRYYTTPGYAEDTTQKGAGEYENGVLRFLENVVERTGKGREGIGLSAEEREFYSLIKRNIRPEYLVDGKYNFRRDVSNDFPVLIKIKLDSDDEVEGSTCDARVKHEVKPDKIAGIAFLPSFPILRLGDSGYVPELNFLPPKEFMAELRKRQQGYKPENYMVYNPMRGELKYAVNFTEDMAIVHDFASKERYDIFVYGRKGRQNTGEICHKDIRGGELYQCTMETKVGNQEIKDVFTFYDGQLQHIAEDIESPSRKVHRRFVMDGERVVRQEDVRDGFYAAVPVSSRPHFGLKDIPPTENITHSLLLKSKKKGLKEAYAELVAQGKSEQAQKALNISEDTCLYLKFALENGWSY